MLLPLRSLGTYMSKLGTYLLEITVQFGYGFPDRAPVYGTDCLWLGGLLL